MSPDPDRRLLSIDALRGLDMLLIVGLGEVVRAAAEVHDAAWLQAVAAQTHHPEWNGFTAWDLIFPLFLFLAGASLPFSFASRLARGATRASLVRHALRRGAVLVLLGAVYNGLLQVDGQAPRIASVLGRIGLAWSGAALIVIYAKPRTQVVIAASILVGYWLLLAFVPVPGQDGPSLEPGATWVDWLDRRLVPGRLYKGVRDPEGLGALPPAIVTALLGTFTGRQLMRADRGGTWKSARLLLAGALALLLGWAWGFVFPINKNLWSSSFVLVTAGCSLLLLGALHQVIDVWRARRWTVPLVVVGANSIAAYLLARFLDFEGAGRLLLSQRGEELVHASVAGLVLLWTLLWLLWRKRIFLRV